MTNEIKFKLMVGNIDRAAKKIGHNALLEVNSMQLSAQTTMVYSCSLRAESQYGDDQTTSQWDKSSCLFCRFFAPLENASSR